VSSGIAIFAALEKHGNYPFHASFYFPRGLNSTVKILKILGVLRKGLPRVAADFGWRITTG
jgi:hypothetical protein